VNNDSDGGADVKYVILIHSNPEPWGHPTDRFTTEGRAQPEEYHQRAEREFDAMMAEIQASGEFVTAEALADPASATLYGWHDGTTVVTDGPYAEAKEHLAGFFVVDCATRERAEELARTFAQPGGVVELRPAMWDGADD
jgi:hypothetical protein